MTKLQFGEGAKKQLLDFDLAYHIFFVVDDTTLDEHVVFKYDNYYVTLYGDDCKAFKFWLEEVAGLRGLQLVPVMAIYNDRERYRVERARIEAANRIQAERARLAAEKWKNESPSEYIK